jgi:predicted thioesterase
VSDAAAPAFVPGYRYSAHWHVRPDMSPPHLPVHVLSTPWMLGLIEQTCHDAARPHLPDHHTLVGTGVTLSHSAPAREGSTVVVDIEVLTIGRRMKFDAVVTLATDDQDDARRPVEVGRATMEMAVVDITRFGR